MRVDQSRYASQAVVVDPHAALLTLADTLDDLEEVRIKAENRYRALTTELAVGERGGSFGKGLPEDVPTVVVAAGLRDGLRDLEERARRELRRAFRAHPYYPWAQRTQGVGDVQGARLLAALGDPWWNDRDQRPRRGLRELRAYCGYDVRLLDQSPSESHVSSTEQAGPGGTDQMTNANQAGIVGVARTPTRGQRLTWNPTVKKRLWLVAESAVKTGVRRNGSDDSAGYDWAGREGRTPYGRLYLEGRAYYAGAVHEVACRRCGPSGHPAPVGSELAPGHQHARALRWVVNKGLLTDLWAEARRLHSSSD